MNRIPSREQVERLRSDIQPEPVSSCIPWMMPGPAAWHHGTVVYVDDMGQLGVEWDNGSALSLIPVKIPFPRSPRRKRKSRNAPVIWGGESEVI